MSLQNASEGVTSENRSDRILTSVLPRILVRHFDANPGALTEPRLHSFTGAAVFADISGFTALTETLAKRGAAGIEELTKVLNQHFGLIIETIHAHGGDIFKFAGDALLALWPAEADDLAQVTERAAHCALATQKSFAELSGAGNLSLRIRIGLGAGPISLLIAGGRNNRWEVVATGDALGQIGPVLHLAQPDEVVLSKEVWKYLENRVECRALDLGAAVLQSFRVSPPAPAHEESETGLAEGTRANLRRLVSPTFVSYLEQGRTDWINELRCVTVMFIHFPGFTHATPVDRVHIVTLILQEVLIRYGGSLNKLSVDDKGAALVGVFGLPTLSHEDDAARGVLAALGIQERLRCLSVEHSIGVTTGMAFCGVVGNASRREYTVIGDVVNLSARLMQKAAGDVLCDEATRDAAPGRAAFEALPPVSLKGKAEPIPVYRPSTLAAESKAKHEAELPIAGREKERAQLAGRLTALAKGEGGALIIEGLAGIGKTRLVIDLIGEAKKHGFPVLQGHASEMDTATPYFAVSEVFRDLFGLERAGAGAAGRDYVSALITTCAGPAWVDRIPLINAVLPLEFPDTPVTAALAGPAWSVETHELLIRLLAGLHLTTGTKEAANGGDEAGPAAVPTMLIIEDAHWLDSASWAFIRQAAKKLTSLMLVMTTRPMGGDAPEEYREIAGDPRAEIVTLGPLERDTIIRIVCQRLGVTSLPDRVASAILTKAEGSPLYSIELGFALRDSGAIVISNGECDIPLEAVDRGEISIPSTLQAAITSRIDRLPASGQVAIKAASAIGVNFTTALLSHIYPIPAERGLVGDFLLGLAQQELISLTSSEVDGRWSFRSAISQQVAYGLMLSTQRRYLHRAIAAWLESGGGGDLASRNQLLAWHWGCVIENGETDPAVISTAADYCIKAGEQAARRSANREAVTLLQNAVKLLGMLPDSSERDQKELAVQCSMGGPLIATKGFAAPDTEHAFSRAWELCRKIGHSPQQFHVLSGLWNFAVGGANLEGAKPLAAELIAVAESSGDPAYRLRADRAAGETAYWTGNYPLARTHLEHVVSLYKPEYHQQEVATTGQDPAVLSLGFLAWAYWLLGMPGKGLITGREQIALAMRCEHPHSIAIATMSQSLLHVFRREPEASRELLAPLAAMAREQGFQLWAAGAMIVWGWIEGELGQAADYIAQIREYVAQWNAGAQIFLPFYVSLLADTYGKAGQFDKGLSFIEIAVGRSEASGEAWWRPELYRMKGTLLLGDSKANTDAAEACFRKAIQAASGQQAKSLELRAAVSLARLLSDTGRREECAGMLEPLVLAIEDGADSADVADARAWISGPPAAA